MSEEPKLDIEKQIALSKLPTMKQAQAIIKRAKAALEWLIDEL